jgi:hypothetical protein
MKTKPLNTMNLIYLSIALFALAAVLGLIILVKWLTSKSASRGVVYSHGIFAAVALVLVIAYSLQNPDKFPKLSLILFVISAIAGFYMFFRTLKNKMSPVSLAILHGLVSVAGFIGLLVFALA